MSRTTKEGKRRGRAIRTLPSYEEGKLLQPISSRHTYGHTEKILRRNRKTWTRLLNKRRRAVDKAKVNETI